MAGRNFYRYASGRGLARSSPRNYLTFGDTTVINVSGYTPDETSDQSIVLNCFSTDSSTTRHIFGMSGSSTFFVARRGAFNDLQARLFSSTNQNKTGIDWQQDDSLRTVTTWLGESNLSAFDWDEAGFETGTCGDTAQSGTFQIGDRQSGINWVGQIWDVEVWDGLPNTGTLIHKWAIDDDNGTVIKDSVGSADGVLDIGNGSWSRETPGARPPEQVFFGQEAVEYDGEPVLF